MKQISGIIAYTFSKLFSFKMLDEKDVPNSKGIKPEVNNMLIEPKPYARNVGLDEYGNPVFFDDFMV